MSNVNPTSIPIKNDNDSRDLTSPYHVEELLAVFRRIQNLTIWQARIVALDFDYNDKYIADIYSEKATNESLAAYRNIEIFEPDIFNRYIVDSWVEVVLDDNYIGLIIPRRLPKGTGRCKVLMLVDDANPGTPDWDYWRFQE